MARPRKWRTVCQVPGITNLGPSNASNGEGKTIELFVDEYETIRLIDYQGLTQEECSHFMGISRTSVQKTYTQARRKIATVLMEGCYLQIRGGDYQECNGDTSRCGCNHCEYEKQKK